jgi:hypothetical protein
VRTDRKRTPTEPRRPLGRPRNPAVDDRIRDATLAVLIDEGYAGVTMESVARREGQVIADLVVDMVESVSRTEARVALPGLLAEYRSDEELLGLMIQRIGAALVGTFLWPDNPTRGARPRVARPGDGRAEDKHRRLNERRQKQPSESGGTT